MRVRALVAALAATATCVISGALVQAPTARAQECSRPNGPLVAYGHSYLRSPQIGGASASYATLAANSLHLNVVIRAVNGGTTADVDKLAHQGSTRWVPGSSQLVLIDSAINDIQQRLPTAQWTGALRHLLSGFATPPVPEILLVRPLQVAAPQHPGRDPKVIAAYAAEQRKVAAEFSAVRIVDASKGWNPKADLSADGIHPNTSGEQHLAKAVQRAAQRTMCAP